MQSRNPAPVQIHYLCFVPNQGNKNCTKALPLLLSPLLSLHPAVCCSVFCIVWVYGCAVGGNVLLFVSNWPTVFLLCLWFEHRKEEHEKTFNYLLQLLLTLRLLLSIMRRRDNLSSSVSRDSRKMALLAYSSPLLVDSLHCKVPLACALSLVLFYFIL